jgi:hypothetical protein
MSAVNTPLRKPVRQAQTSADNFPLKRLKCHCGAATFDSLSETTSDKCRQLVLYPGVTPRAVDVVNSDPLPRVTPEATMAKSFTDIVIRNLEAADVRREIPDPGCAGLYVIVQPSAMSLPVLSDCKRNKAQKLATCSRMREASRSGVWASPG